MQNIRANKEMAICDLVLDMDVLDVLGQLCESDAIKYSEIKDSEWAYQLSNR